LKAVKAPTFTGVPHTPKKIALDEIPMSIITAVDCTSLGDGGVLEIG